MGNNNYDGMIHHTDPSVFGQHAFSGGEAPGSSLGSNSIMGSHPEDGTTEVDVKGGSGLPPGYLPSSSKGSRLADAGRTNSDARGSASGLTAGYPSQSNMGTTVSQSPEEAAAGKSGGYLAQKQAALEQRADAEQEKSDELENKRGRMANPTLGH